ncbi:MAG TPA: hypothetical protein P5092_17600 [Ruminococcus sp.]|nr:hypothetical protein [Ruminococcus sp.]
MLISLDKITTPVVLIINGTETEYRSGGDAVKSLGMHNHLEAAEITAQGNKIIVRLEPRKNDAPDNYVGEAGIE